MSEITQFYNGRMNKNGMILDEIWDYDYEKLEHVHNYIQWLFPIVEPDYWNRDTPKLTPEDINEFKADVDLQIKLLTSLEVMLDFWGFKINYYENGIEISKSKNYEERKLNWQTKTNHNFLRMTRVIHCLNDLGLKRVGDAFFNCLMEVVDENPDKFNQFTVEFWKKASVMNMNGEMY
jgi:hypothetical protein